MNGGICVAVCLCSDHWKLTSVTQKVCVNNELRWGRWRIPSSSVVIHNSFNLSIHLHQDFFFFAIAGSSLLTVSMTPGENGWKRNVLSNMLNLNWYKWHYINREPFRKYTHNSHQHTQTQVRTNTHAQRHVHPRLFNEIQLVFFRQTLFRLLFSSLYL